MPTFDLSFGSVSWILSDVDFEPFETLSGRNSGKFFCRALLGLKDVLPRHGCDKKVVTRSIHQVPKFPGFMLVQVLLDVLQSQVFSSSPRKLKFRKFFRLQFAQAWRPGCAALIVLKINFSIHFPWILNFAKIVAQNVFNILVCTVSVLP
jgi:hypothetical protein